MRLYIDGRQSELVSDNLPYENVLAALRDGWRVIKVPGLAVLLDERRTIGLGCEFVLERNS